MSEQRTRYPKDLTGMRFGKLTVVEEVESKKPKGSKKRVRFYRCVCDCGRETIAERYNLLEGRKKSCGCTRTNNKSAKYKDKACELFRQGMSRMAIARELGLSATSVNRYVRGITAKEAVMDSPQTKIQFARAWYADFACDWTDTVNKIRRYYGMEEFPMPKAEVSE